MPSNTFAMYRKLYKSHTPRKSLYALTFGQVQSHRKVGKVRLKYVLQVS